MSSSSGFTALQLKSAFDAVLGTRAIFEKRGRLTGGVVRRYVEVAFERIQTADGSGISQEKHGVLRYYAGEKDAPTSKLGSYLLSSDASATIVKQEGTDKYLVRVQGVYRRNKAGGAAALNPTEVQINAETADAARKWRGAVLFAALPPRMVKALSGAAAFTPETLVRSTKGGGDGDKRGRRAGMNGGKRHGDRANTGEQVHTSPLSSSSAASPSSVATTDRAAEDDLQAWRRERMEQTRKRGAKQEELLRRRTRKKEEEDTEKTLKQQNKDEEEREEGEEGEGKKHETFKAKSENESIDKKKLYRKASQRQREEEEARKLFRKRRQETEEAQRRERERRREDEEMLKSTEAVLDKLSRAGVAMGSQGRATEAETEVEIAPRNAMQQEREQEPAGPLVVELGLRLGRDERVIFRCASHLLCCAYKPADFEFEGPRTSGDEEGAFFLPRDSALGLTAAEQKWMRKQLRLRDVFVSGPPGRDPRRRAPALAEKAEREAKEWAGALDTFYDAVSRPSPFMVEGRNGSVSEWVIAARSVVVLLLSPCLALPCLALPHLVSWSVTCSVRSER